MLSEKISSAVLSVGCEYKHPKGGIAQVMNTYYSCLFPRFRCVVNSGGNNKIIKLWRLVKSLLQSVVLLLFDKDIKIIHIHTASNVSFQRSALWVRLAKLMNKKVIMHMHGGAFKEYYESNPRWIKSVLDQCDAIIALSDSWNHYFAEELKCKQVETVKNVIPNPVLMDIKKDDAVIHLLFLGLITEEKGIFDFLEMLGEHKEELQDRIVLHIGGNGKIDKMNNIIESLGLGACVKYEGFVSGQKKTDLLNISDVFVLPSYIEGLPISILEAMSYSMPILTTPVGGIPEIVQDDVNGKIFSPGDKHGMYMALKSMLEHPEQMMKMGNASRQFVQSYLPKPVSEQLQGIYVKLIKNY